MHDRRLAIALFVLALGAYVYFYGGWGANQEANYALTRAIVEARTFAIDDFTVREGDIAEGRGGRIYSNKTPGLSFLGVAPYALFRAVQQRGIVKFRDPWLAGKQLVTVAVCGVAGALIAPILFLYARRRLNVPRFDACIVCIVVAFGTIVFPYSTMFFAHVPSALFLLIAFVLLRSRPFWAGLAAGISGACFFISAVAAIVLALFALRESIRKAALFVAGGLPVAVGLAVYQWICFGSPFTTPVEKSAAYLEKGRVLGVFAMPKLAPLAAITFSEYRGLFYCSPVLLLAVVGAAIMIRRRQYRWDLFAAALMAAVFLLANASFNGWHGGAAFGPRYLLAIVPFLAIPMFFAAGRFRILWLVLGVVSIGVNLLATAVDAMPIDGYTKPFTGYIIPSFLARPISAEARAIEYPDCRTPRCETNEVSLAQEAGNPGERWFGRGKRASILPGLLWIAIGSALTLAAAAKLDVSAAVSPRGGETSTGP